MLSKAKYLHKYKTLFLNKKFIIIFVSMKKIISCFLILCACTLLSNVAFASNNLKSKTFYDAKSDVSKMEVVSNDVLTFEQIDYLATYSFCLETKYTNAFNKTLNHVNVFIVPDRLTLNHNRVVHKTSYILKLPKNDILPRNHNWRFGTNYRY